MKRLWAILGHLCLILSLTAAVLVVLDGYNPRLAFLTGPLPKALLLGLCLCAALLGVLTVLRERREEKSENSTDP